MKIGGFGQRDNATGNCFTIQNAGHIMRCEGRSFAPSRAREFGKQGIRECARDFRKGVSVEKKKRRLAMIGAEPI